MPKLEEVFGISSKPVLSYAERDQVDGEFVKALSGDRHIVIYGSSKQGKTALRQKHLPDNKCIIVRCGPKTTPETIYQSILRDAGVTIESLETRTEGVKGSAKAKWGFKTILPFFGGADAEGEVSGEASTQKAIQTQFIGFDLGDAQAVTELLASPKYSKNVVLENYHYLPEDTRKQIAFDLKTFHEVSIRFVILGIWKEANYLLMYNGDLQDRVVEVPVEPWENDDFDLVMNNGCKLLNIDMNATARKQFKENAYGNIGMLQEFARTYCRLSGIRDKQAQLVPIGGPEDINKTFDAKLTDQRGRLAKVLQTIAGKSRIGTHTPNPLVLPYYLVRVLLSAPISELTEGIRRPQLLEKLKQCHYRENKETIRMSDVSNLLKRIPALQEDIQPPFLYYDNNQQRLKIVDATQFFVLARIDREELWEEIPNPLEKYDDE